MPDLLVEVSTPVQGSSRLAQISSLMDVTVEEKSTNRWDVHLPVEDRDWLVGMVVGPSGSGKSSVARALWPDAYSQGHRWSPDRSLVDDFPAGMGIKDITGLLGSVGLGSVPVWLRPYRTLSNGEQFRADIARALAETEGLVVVDEFTSVVDRQVAKVASHTVQKAVRRSGRRFVAVTCHYDIAEWLRPDWVYEVPTDTLTWGSVPSRPALDLRVHQVDRSVWPLFRLHHYLSGELFTAAVCFGGFIGDDLVAFTSYRHFPHAYAKNIKMGHRLVVLPDYQGLGIGGRLDDWLGQYLWDRNYRYRNVVAHPAMIHYYQASPRWRDTTSAPRLRAGELNAAVRRAPLATRRLGTRSFEYTAPKAGM